MDGTEIISRFNDLEQQRKTIDQTWDIIKRFMMPYRGEFFRPQHSEHEVEWRRNREIYDSTGVMGVQTLASSLHGTVTSAVSTWFGMEWRHHELQADEDAVLWIQRASEVMADALQDSNFGVESAESYIDIVGYGTAFISEEVLDEDTGEIQFDAIPVEQSYFEPDANGQPFNFYRKLIWSPIQIWNHFGEDTPDYILKQAKTPGNADTKHEIIFCIYTRKVKKDEYDKGIRGYPLVPEERPFGYKYVIRESGDTVGMGGGYYEMPVFVPRWRKTVGSIWGHSPAMLALPDVLTVNEYVELILKAGTKVVDPATLVTERGLLSDLDLEPAGLTVVRSLDDIGTYESKARFDVSDIQVDKLRSAIRSTFFVDQLELKDSPAMTATEVQVRYELMQRLLGPTMGRLKTDYLDPLLQRTFNICFRANKFDEMPEIVEEAYAAGKGDFEVKYIGPLARAQKVDSVRAIQEWSAFMAEMANLNPEILDIMDFDQIAKELAALSNVPQELMRKVAEVKKIRAKREEQQQAQMEAEQNQLNSAAAKDMAAAEQQQEGEV